MAQKIEDALKRLEKSPFRSHFHLSEKEKQYITKKGMEEIRKHAVFFVKDRLSANNPVHDGKQTPMKGHPVFIAQHATATCCRGCLEKWYHVKKGTALTEIQQEKIVNLIMAWIEKEYKKSSD